MDGDPVAQRLRWYNSKSILAAQDIYSPADLLPALNGILPIRRACNRTRFGPRAYFPDGFTQLCLADQQEACQRFLRKLLKKGVLPRGSCPDPHHPFDQLFVIIRHEVVTGPDLNERFATTRPAHHITTHEEVQCLPLAKGTYQRLNLTGMRGKDLYPCREWVHRMVCWLARGPPPPAPQRS